MLHRPLTHTSHGDPFQGLQTLLSAYDTRVLLEMPVHCNRYSIHKRRQKHHGLCKGHS